MRNATVTAQVEGLVSAHFTRTGARAEPRRTGMLRPTRSTSDRVSDGIVVVGSCGFAAVTGLAGVGGSGTAARAALAFTRPPVTTLPASDAMGTVVDVIASFS